MNPTKRQLEVAIILAVKWYENKGRRFKCEDFPHKRQCDYYSKKSCSLTKCENSIVAHFLSLALDKIGKEKKHGKV